jgi:hypothetical protein
MHTWSGPYILVEQTSPVNFKVVQGHDLTPLKNPIHVNRFKPFVSRTLKPPTPDELLQLVNSQEEEITLDDIIPEDRPIINDNDTPTNDKNETNLTDLDNTHEEQPDKNIDTKDKLPDNDHADISLNQSDVYEVEKVIKGRYKKNGSVEYLVHWKGYSEKDRTWEPVDNLNQAILDYIGTNPVPMLKLQNKKV